MKNKTKILWKGSYSYYLGIGREIIEDTELIVEIPYDKKTNDKFINRIQYCRRMISRINNE